MVKGLNKILRSIFIVTGIVLVILNLTEKNTPEKSKKHGYQSEMYDDIW